MLCHWGANRAMRTTNTEAGRSDAHLVPSWLQEAPRRAGLPSQWGSCCLPAGFRRGDRAISQCAAGMWGPQPRSAGETSIL